MKSLLGIGTIKAIKNEDYFYLLFWLELVILLIITEIFVSISGIFKKGPPEMELPSWDGWKARKVVTDAFSTQWCLLLFGPSAPSGEQNESWVYRIESFLPYDMSLGLNQMYTYPMGKYIHKAHP